MQRVRIRKNVEIKNLPFPGPVITRDLIGRIETVEHTYQSIVVTYNATWFGETNTLVTYTQDIVDKV